MEKIAFIIGNRSPGRDICRKLNTVQMILEVLANNKITVHDDVLRNSLFIHSWKNGCNPRVVEYTYDTNDLYNLSALEIVNVIVEKYGDFLLGR